ncbi:MAG: SAM-dependent methyltransferase [Rhizobiaceae bacterium]|nr:SAM-dependent methyltransferase [Rhizobiaceae bacterium]
MNAPAVMRKQADIALVVERARGLLTEGDVMAARMLASGAYDQAKAAASFAKRFQAGTELIGKAHQLQGDALWIETQAKVRLADEYDAAQERGEIKKTGNPNSSRTEELPGAADIGLSHKDIHEARKLRDAERREPGIVERAIAARLAAGLEPSRANLRAAVGTATATKEERGHNLYETPPEAMRVLLAWMRFAPNVWEPACGRGAISREMEAAGYDVSLSDLVDYGTATKHGECQDVADFLTTEARPDRPDIVTNPPYGGTLNAFVAHALRVHRPRKMALLLNLNFLAGFDDPDRCFAMDEHPPCRVIVFTRRLPMMHRDGWDGPEASSRMNCAWFVWELDEATDSYDAGGKRDTLLLRVDWKTFENTAPCGPLEPQAKASEDNGATGSDSEVPTDSMAGEASRVDAGRTASATSERMDAPGGESAATFSFPITWHQPYEGGRLLAKSGEIELGAVFPDGDTGRCTWCFWLGRSAAPPHKHARTVEAGKKALTKEWRGFLGRAGLAVAA